MSREVDVTEPLHRYRECCRGLWNNFLRAPNFDRVEVFDEVCRALFLEIVLRLSGRHEYVRTEGAPIPFLRVVPTIETIPAMVRRATSTERNAYWDDPVGRVPRSARMLYLDCFDWE